mmetsp:Transcript_2117/g.2213  ORF Transcript_2117/g.2213 Transcript_2117/m.2213 type:complete len:129 (-) Transcript_2117:398-784(-)
MSQAKKMDALKEIVTKLKAKEDVPVELWKIGGFPAPKRLKDVEQAIVALKKTFSADHKSRELEEEMEEAEAQGMTLEEFREANKKKRDTDQQQDKRKLDEERKAGREKKDLSSKLARGDFDMQVDYVE